MYMAGALHEGSQGVGHPYLTALLLLAIIGGFFVSGGNNLSTTKPTPNSGVVTVIPGAAGGKADNLQLYTFGHEVANPLGSGSAIPTLSDPDPQISGQPLPDCPSHGEKTATCQCPTREETWAYCPQTGATCQDGGTIGSAPVPGTDPNQKYCVYC